MSTDKGWTSEWFKAQQKFVESWSEMSKDWHNQDSDSQANHWANGLDMWRKTYPYPYPTKPETDEVITKCMDIGKGYFSMAEQIGKQIASGGKPDQVIHQWLEQLKSSLQQTDLWSPTQQQATNDLMAQWMSPSTSWQKMAATMMPFQIPTSNHDNWGLGEDYAQLNQLLSTPGLGFFREAQEKNQAGIKLMMEYQQANQKFNQSFIRVSIESLQSFQQKITELFESETESAPASLRALYDLWVEISENCYADYAMTEEYQSLYGDMVNKLMALKKHYSELVDESFARLNLPTRREVDTMQQRLQETRRENRALKREMKEIRSLIAKTQSTNRKPVRKSAAANKAKTRKATPKKTRAKPQAGAKS